MAQFTTEELAAIEWWKTDTNSRLMLSARPLVEFRRKDGRVFKTNVSNLVGMHKEFKKELRQEQARQRNLEKRRATRIK